MTNTTRSNRSSRDLGRRPRFLSEADCHDVLARLTRFTTAGGYTSIALTSTWTGNVRWARNRITTSGEVSDNSVQLSRNVNGAGDFVTLNDTTDEALFAAARRAERLVRMRDEGPNAAMLARLPLEPVSMPHLFSDATYQLSAEDRAATAVALMAKASAAGMLSAGYIEVKAIGLGAFDTAGRVRYFAYTQARYSVTVRDPKGAGSGWAGVDHDDWTKIDTATLTTIALDKCLRSRNPALIEPGRYTTIMESQATADFAGTLLRFGALARNDNEGVKRNGGTFWKSPGFSRLGERVVDERITISTDPMDPELGSSPIEASFDMVYHPATWIDHGILTNLIWTRTFGIEHMDSNTGLESNGSFRMSGGPTSVAEMIATTKRGLLVTRFDQLRLLDDASFLCTGYTRDGLWLIEDGKISKPVRNLKFTESVLLALNSVEQLGPPQRVFSPGIPVIAPPMKVRDLSFTSITSAI